MTDESKASPAVPSLPQAVSSGEVYRMAMHMAPTPMMVVDGHGTVKVVNQAAERLFGYESSELVGNPVEILVPPGLQDLHEALRAAFAKEPEARPMGMQRDLFAVRKSGEEIPVEIGLSPISTPEGLLILCIIVDLSARKKLEEGLSDLAELLTEKNEELHRMVTMDALTSLRTRRVFMETLEGQLEAAVRHARPLSVLILDIDHFKAYNDTFGHLAGDEVLRRVGKILLEVARRSDVVARIGGEEMGMILPETDQEGAMILAERFRSAVEAAEWPKRPITASLGATTVDFEQSVPRPEVPSLSTILRKADEALYRSKAQGRNRVIHSAHPGAGARTDPGS